VIVGLALGAALGAALLALLLRPASTAPITDSDGRPVPGSVAALETVRLGGVEQHLLIRGWSTKNPVLLYLHGGPGTSELGMVRVHNCPVLEKHFTVVLWEQRGAGKSFAAIEPASGMTVEQLVADTCELAAWLCARFGQEKIYVAGHSWGSALGVLAVRRRPELFRAYVGIGQVANMREGERLSWEWTLAQAERAGDARAVAKLRRIGPPPYGGELRPKLVAQRSLLARYGGEVHGNPRGGMLVLLGALLRAREYTWRDRVNVFRGVFAAMRLLWPQILSIDLFAQAPELEVPVYFLLGRHDHEAPAALAERYFEALRAPRKALVWFERSAHFVNTEEADAFHRFFVERLLPETAPQPGALERAGS
jgi:pimeloyl-ACP methyl ester carboxylesterase